MSTAVKLILNGTFFWAKVFTFNRQMRDHMGDLIKAKPQNLVDDADAGKYEIEIRISQEEAKKIAKAGARQKPKMDKETGFPAQFEEGYAYRFSRFHSVPKAPKAGGMPEIVFRDGTPFDPDVHGLIGNGTTGSLEIRVDKFMVNVQGRSEAAARSVLQKIIIDELVEYRQNNSEDDMEVIGGDDEPAPKAAAKPATQAQAKPQAQEAAAEKPAPKASRPINEDEIPFE